MTFSEFRQFLATTSSFRQYGPSFSRSFSAPLTTGPAGMRGCGLGDFTANSVGRLAGDGKSTGKEAVGYFERLFQRDTNTVEGDFDVFTSPRLAVCRSAAAAPPPSSRINEGNSSTTTDIRRGGKRKQDTLEKIGVKKEIGIGIGIGGEEDLRGYLKEGDEGEGEGEEEDENEGENKACEIKNPKYSFFPNKDDKISYSDIHKKTDNSIEKQEQYVHKFSDNENEFDMSRDNITERRTYSRHFTTSGKVSRKSKRAFYGDRRNFYTDNAQVGSRGVGEVGGVGVVGGIGGVGVGGVGEKVEERRDENSEEKGGEKGRNGIRMNIPNELWMRLTDEDEEEEEEENENDAKPSPSYNHTMCHLDKLEGTEGMRSL